MYSRQFWLLCVSNFLFTASFQMMIPELPEYLHQMGGQAYIGLIIALFTLTAGLSRPFSGKITDTVGRIPVMAFGSLVCCVCSLFYPFVHIVGAFLWLRLIHGMSTGTKPTATAAYVADIIPDNRRGEAAGMLGIFTATGMSFGPTMGNYITDWYDINVTFYVCSALALLSIIILLNMKETLVERQPFSFKLLNIKWKDIYEPRVIPSFVVMFFLSFPSGVAITLAPDFCKSIGIDNKGLFFTIYTLASLAIRLVASKSSDKYGRVPVLMASSIVLALGMAIMGFWPSEAGLWIGSILFGMSNGMNMPTLTAWTVDMSESEHRGRALAMMYMALEGGIGIGALWSGSWYAGNTQHIAFTFYVSAGLALLSLVYLLVREKRRAVTH